MLDRYPITWTILDTGIPANAVLAHLPGWHRVYTDDAATVFARPGT